MNIMCKSPSQLELKNLLTFSSYKEEFYVELFLTVDNSMILFCI